MFDEYHYGPGMWVLIALTKSAKILDSLHAGKFHAFVVCSLLALNKINFKKSGMLSGC